MSYKKNESVRMKPEGKKRSPMAVVLFCLMMAVLLTLGVTFSKYITFTGENSSARVAMFVFDVNDTEQTEVANLEAIQKPGDSATYTFQLTNRRTNAISEVAEKYTVSFTALGSLPLTYELKETAGQQKSVVADTNGNALSAEGTFAANVETNKTYALTATWPESEKDPKYASGSGVASLLIEIQGEQID